MRNATIVKQDFKKNSDQSEGGLHIEFSLDFDEIAYTAKSAFYQNLLYTSDVMELAILFYLEHMPMTAFHYIRVLKTGSS